MDIGITIKIQLIFVAPTQQIQDVQQTSRKEVHMEPPSRRSDETCAGGGIEDGLGASGPGVGGWGELVNSNTTS